jgi:hypothetical protein
MKHAARYEKIRARLFLAMGLTLVPACTEHGKSPPTDAGHADAPPGDAGVDAPPTVRRPFLIGASLRSSVATRRNDWTGKHRDAAAALDPKTAAALARAWEQDALEEHASIAAFSRFSLHLLSIGAPPDLIRDAHRAAIDEVRHAEAAFALAQRYGGRGVGPGHLEVHDALAALTLAEIAELTAEEGCVGETLGAILAGEQANLATDPVAQDILRGLARDELRHAELAWRFVRWAVEAGGDDVLAAVTRGIRRAAAGTLAAPRRTYDVDLVAWHAHGRVTCDEARAIAAAGIAQVIEPALAGLAAKRELRGVREALA